MDDEGADTPIAEIFNTSENRYTKMKNVRWKIKNRGERLYCDVKIAKTSLRFTIYFPRFYFHLIRYHEI